MNTLAKLWEKLSGKKYRESFVASQLKRGIPFQIRALRKERGWSQDDLAEKAGVTQGVISRAEDPDYGNLTFNTILRIAAGLDIAFVGRFVPFSELGKWFIELSERSVQVPSFENDSGFIERKPAIQAHDVGGFSMTALASGDLTGSAHILTGRSARGYLSLTPPVPSGAMTERTGKVLTIAAGRPIITETAVNPNVFGVSHPAANILANAIGGK